LPNIWTGHGIMAPIRRDASRIHPISLTIAQRSNSRRYRSPKPRILPGPAGAEALELPAEVIEKSYPPSLASRVKYTFDHLAEVIDRFTGVIGLARYAVYVFDYGAPIGFRLALRHPERITAVISQNGNAYEEGLNQGCNPIQRYWTNPTLENRAALRDFLTPEAAWSQYVHGVPDESLLAPESYALDSALLAHPGNDEIQLDLFLDYASNVALYPKFQEYFRTQRPRLLAIWSRNDPFFLPPGADAFKRDNPNAEVRFIETGHFALETHHAEIAAAIRDFLGRRPAPIPAPTRVHGA
jgi:pimeloyl-ACP methyl ester carboxylesterase